MGQLTISMAIFNSISIAMLVYQRVNIPPLITRSTGQPPSTNIRGMADMAHAVGRKGKQQAIRYLENKNGLWKTLQRKCWSYSHWIGFVGKIWKPETHGFLPWRSWGVIFCKFSHHPILWYSSIIPSPVHTKHPWMPRFLFRGGCRAWTMMNHGKEMLKERITLWQTFT